MKVALVHDYIKEYGGAERVLKTLTEIYPQAPIYTAFKVAGSTAGKEFSDKEIIESKLAPILKIGNLFSPLRFLIPIIWGSFDLSGYDLVITSCSWYITRGFKVGEGTEVIAYCHTPPRWLYGYKTSVGFTKYWPVKIYAATVGHFLRMYDFKTAQKINLWIANSKNVAGRIWKCYRKRAVVIYPPVDTTGGGPLVEGGKDDYFLIVSRIVGAKGIEEAVSIFEKLGRKLKIIGEQHGYSKVGANITPQASENIEYLGRVPDEKLWELYSRAKAFVALARDEDFGMSVVEAQAAGTPVIAFNGGGFRESVINGETGVLIDEVSVESLKRAIKRIEAVRWDKNILTKNVQKFSKDEFKKKMVEFVNKHAGASRS